MNKFGDYCYFEQAVEHSDKWHELRKKGIGGSDAACVLGMNPYKTNIELWEEKTGIKPPPDLSDNEAVMFGSKSEEHIREIYVLKKKVNVQKLDGTLISKKHSFMRVNLDGYIESDHGLLEIKTSTLRKHSQLKDWGYYDTTLEKWVSKIPQNYYVQCIHALAVTGAAYIDLVALLYLGFSSSNTVAEMREYRITREEVLKDIELLILEEQEFWTSVQNNEMPYLKMKY